MQVYTLLHQLKSQINVAAIILNEGELSAKLREAGVKTWVVDESKLSAAQQFIGICKIFRQFKPDIIHTHRQKENIFGSIANVLTLRRPCVRTVHGAPEFKPSGMGKVQSTLDKFCGNYLQKGIIAVSADLKEKLLKTFPKGRLYVINNGISPGDVSHDIEQPDFKLNDPEAVHIGIIGRLDPVKRVDLFIDMAHLLVTTHKDIKWQFHIFGEGKLETEMKMRAQATKAPIIFHGHRMDIRNCIHGLHAVVMPSDHEGLPMTALESLAIGTRFICHDVGGLSKLFEKQPEFLVQTHSPEGYAEKVIQAIDGNSTLPGFPEEYTITSTAAETLGLYNNFFKN